MTGKSRLLRRGIALMAACTGLLLGAFPAVAATVTGPTDGLSISTVEAGRAVELTIRLTRSNPFDDPAPQSPPRGPLAGTVFTARKIAGVDLTTAAGWSRARAITVAQARRGPFDHVASATTDGDGEARLVALPVGLYLVTSVPPDALHDYPDSAPFLITLPTGGQGGWDYAPRVYAKPGPEGPTTTATAPPTWPPILPPGWPTGVPPSGASQSPVLPGGMIPPGGTPPSRPPIDGGAPVAHSSEGSTSRGPLASTGAAVAVLVGVASVLVGLGLLLKFLARHRDPAGD